MSSWHDVADIGDRILMDSLSAPRILVVYELGFWVLLTYRWLFVMLGPRIIVIALDPALLF